MFSISDSNISSRISIEHAFPKLKLNETEVKKNPNSPLIKSPFIKLKLEAKNLDYGLKNLDDLRPYIKITLGNHEQKTR